MLYDMYKESIMRIFLNAFPILSLVLVTALFALSAKAQTADLTAEQLLEKVDQYRNFKDTAFSFDLELTSEEKSKTPKQFLLHAKVLNSHTSLVAYRQPVREQGKALLMNGRNLWFFSSMAQKPIRITPQQRLLGEASNGDVASTDFSGDYAPSFYENAVAEQNQKVIQLNAKPESLAAYNRIHLWVDATSAQPVKAEFYTESGKHLKTAYYTGFLKLEAMGNKIQLSEIEIRNALREGDVTRMRYSNFQLEDLQENQFRPEQVRRLIAQ